MTYGSPIGTIGGLLPPRHRRTARRILLRSSAGAAPHLVRARGRDDAGALRRASGLGALLAAAAIESPPVAGVLALLAAFAALRSSGGRSGLGAVAPSVAAGAASATATLLVFPRVDASPARGVAVALRKHVAPLPDGTGLTVVVNELSGSGTAGAVVDEIQTGLPGAEIVACEEGGDLETSLTQAAAWCRSLGIVGGDGSVNTAARIALDAGVPLVVFPGGTLNHFARDLGIGSIGEAMEAVREGQVVAIDVGMIAGRPFLNNASLGSYTDLVDERERLERRLGKWPAMVVALVRVLRRGRRFHVCLDGVDHEVWMVFFGNGLYEPAGFAPSDRPDLVDGLLDIRIVNAAPPFSRLRLVVAMLFGALARSVVYERQSVTTVSVRIHGDEGVRLAADGETFDGEEAFVVSKRPAALLVHVLEH
jgi:diacylglycerol kinase family enzyme